jgi:hypothetical protein
MFLLGILNDSYIYADDILPAYKNDRQKSEIEAREVRFYNIKRSEASTNLKKYPLENAFDKDLNRVWVAGTKGNDKGQWIEVEFKNPIPIGVIGIVNGYRKNEATYYNNRRVKKLKLEMFKEGKKIKESVVDLVDREYYEGGFVSNLDYILKDNYKGYIMDKFRLTILDTYEGNKYDDLCIDEILILNEEDYYKYKLKKLYNKKNLTKRDHSDLLKYLSYVDDYNMGEDIYLDSLIGIIDVNTMEEKDYKNLFYITNHVDGAAAEAYGFIIYEAFLRDSGVFMKELIKNDFLMENYVGHIVFESKFKEEKNLVCDKLDSLIHSDRFSEDEKAKIKKFKSRYLNEYEKF